MRTVRIHIGPLKTGSTTVQHMLERGRSRMLNAGFLYPRTAPAGAGHLEAVLDFVSSTDHTSPWRSNFVVTYAKHQPPRRRGAWQALRDEIRGQAGPSVISHEVLCHIPTAIAADFIEEVGADQAEVVMVRRRPSEIVPSLFLERIKTQREVSFPEFVRRLFIELPVSGASEHEFIDSCRLASTWRQAGAEVTVVDAANGLSDEVIVEVAETLTPGLTWTAPQEPSNVSMSAHGAQLWTDHCSAHAPAFIASAHAVRQRMLTTFPQTANGPRLQLSPEAAAALDAYCEGQTDTLPDLPRLTAPVPPLPFDGPAALRLMARWQRKEDLKWKAIDAASTISGRGHLMPGLF